MDPTEVAAREAVRDLMARHAHAVDTGRTERVVALFAPEGVLEVPGEPQSWVAG